MQQQVFHIYLCMAHIHNVLISVCDLERKQVVLHMDLEHSTAIESFWSGLIWSHINCRKLHSIHAHWVIKR
jgi:hypothetical protein